MSTDCEGSRADAPLVAAGVRRGGALYADETRVIYSGWEVETGRPALLCLARERGGLQDDYDSLRPVFDVQGDGSAFALVVAPAGDPLSVLVATAVGIELRRRHGLGQPLPVAGEMSHAGPACLRASLEVDEPAVWRAVAKLLPLEGPAADLVFAWRETPPVSTLDGVTTLVRCFVDDLVGRRLALVARQDALVWLGRRLRLMSCLDRLGRAVRPPNAPSAETTALGLRWEGDLLWTASVGVTNPARARQWIRSHADRQDSAELRRWLAATLAVRTLTLLLRTAA